MQTILKSGSLLALALLLLSPGWVQAQDDVDPARLFQRCKNAVQTKTEGCVRHMNATSKECAQLIERLLNAGHEERAKHVARRCLHSIEVTSASCRRSIINICEECIRRLVRLEAEELARRLHGICKRAVAAVEEAEEQAKQRIRRLF